MRSAAMQRRVRRLAREAAGSDGENCRRVRVRAAGNDSLVHHQRPDQCLPQPHRPCNMHVTARHVAGVKSIDLWDWGSQSAMVTYKAGKWRLGFGLLLWPALALAFAPGLHKQPCALVPAAKVYVMDIADINVSIRNVCMELG